jgi:hypothetical protein
MKILIDTDWAMFIADLPTDKQLEFFWAVFDYGNRDCNLKCWDKVKPILEKGKIGYYNKLKKLKQFTDTDTDTVADTDTDTVADTDTDTVADTDTVRGSVSVSKRKEYTRNSNSSIWNTRANKFTPPTLKDVLDYAKEQSAMTGVGGFSCPQKIAEEFWTHYDSQGWVKSNDAKTPITNWKSLLRSWTLNPNKFSHVGKAAPADYDLPL